ncbi:MAG: Ig-like domain-containing protein, partial [Dongiaceae bacterium]
MVDRIGQGEDGERGAALDEAEPWQVAQAAGAPGEPIGSVKELSGTVTLTHADGTIEPASAGTPVYLDDTVATSADGAVEIVFVDGMTFSLGGNAEMDLNNLVYNPGGSSNALDLSVVKGAFVFITGGIAPAEGEGVKIDTPAGTIGIRGTSGGGTQDQQTGGWVFSLFRDPDGQVGRIVITNAAGTVVLDEALETTQVGSALTEPSQTFVLTDEQAAALFADALASLQDQLDLGANPQDVEPEAGPEQPAPDPQSLLGELSDIVDGLGIGAETLLDIISSELNEQFGSAETTGDTTSNTLDSTDSGAGGSEGSDGSTGEITTPVTDNTFNPTPPPEPPELIGNDNDNTLTGTTGPELIQGLGGNDSLAGGGGNDTVEGGTGNDTIDGGAGNDTVEGGTGDDSMDGGDGTNVAVFSGPLADYTILVNGGQLALVVGGGGPLALVPPDAVITVIGPDGTDTLTNVDVLRFSDKDVFVGGPNHDPETPTDGDAAANTVAEDAAIGATVGIDADSFDCDLLDEVTYSLTDDAGGLFAIDPTTGVVTVAGALDFEAATSHQITVQASDGNGGTSSQSFILAVTNVDDTPPAAPIITGFSDDTGTVGDGITGDNTLVIEGFAEALSTVEVFQDGQSIGTTTSNSDGNWSFDHTGTILDDSTYVFTATATDAAGNTSALSAALNVTIETAVPTAVEDFGFVNEAQEDQLSATNGAAMKTAVTVTAGAVLTLQFNFLDSEPPEDEAFFKDFAVVVIDGQVFHLANVDDATNPLGA